MIRITRKMIENMYDECDNQEAVNDDGWSANTIRMQTEFDDGNKLQINVYSYYTNQKIRIGLIQEGETDRNLIFKQAHYFEDVYSIDSEDDYVIDKKATDFLHELHNKFSYDMKCFDLDLIQMEIYEHQVDLDLKYEAKKN